MLNLVNDTVDKNDILALVEWLKQEPIPRLTKGKLTIELEQKWANKIGTNFSVYVNSGSSAILLTLAALLESKKLKNKKIVVPSLSWATDVSSPILLGMEPVMCDCNFQDLSCDLDHLEELFKTQNPAALILVSPLGLIPDMKKIVDLCQKYDIILLEDVCESMGSKFQNRYLGTFGVASFFSLYFGHHLSTIEGGFINTNNEDLYHYLLMMRSHGWDRDLPALKQQQLRSQYNISDFESLYNFYVPGFNLRATDLQAFIGLRALDKLDNYAYKRNKNYQVYIKNIKANEINFKEETPGDFISNFAFPIVNVNRDTIVKKLINSNIETRPLIAGNMAAKPMWTERYGKVNLPNCERINQYGFYIPNHQDLSENDIMSICSLINEI